MPEERPLFIAHVIHHLQIGGLENGVVNLINRMPRERFRHAVICIEDFSPQFRQRIRTPGVEVYALQRSRIGVWRLRWRLWRLFRRLRPDIVHSRNLSGLDALLPARLAGCHTVHSEHGFDVDNLHGQAARPALLRRLHAPLVRGYVCVSQDLHRLMTTQWGMRPAKVRQIYNGVDTERFTPAVPHRLDLLPEAWRASDPFVVGTVGRVQAVKDQATLLRAVAALLQRRPALCERLRLVIVGDGPLLVELRAMAATLGLERNVWFTGARSDVAPLMQAFDLFVLTSLNEGISNTLLEAMATGLPLLATAVGGNVELLEEGVVGATFAPRDAARLSTMIEAYADNEALCVAHGAAARRRAVQSFSLQAMVAGYAEVYQGL